MIEIALYDRKTVAKFFVKGNRIKFLLHSSVQSFTDSICLPLPNLGFTVIDAFNCQVQLAFVLLGLSLGFRSRLARTRSREI